MTGINRTKKCMMCRKEFDANEERFRTGFAKKKLIVCESCFDTRYGKEGEK